MEFLSSDKVADIIASIPIFKELGPLEIRYLSQVVEWKSFPPGSVMFRQGEKGESLFFVVSGMIEIMREEEGKMFTIAELGSGSILGEMSILENADRMATAVSARDTEVLEIKKKRLERLFARHAVIGYKVMKRIAVILSQRLRRADAMISFEERSRKLG